MEPLFKEGDRIVINRWAYIFSKPTPGDFVTFEHPNKKGKVLLKKIKKVVGDESLVTGINENDSEDSRRFGKIKGDKILGKVWFKY